MSKITLTDEEKAALKGVTLMLRANLTEHMPPLQRRAVSWATETLEQLLKRSHKRKTMDKLSDEQVRVWAEEWEVECQMRLQTKQYGEWEWFGRRNDYIAHKAYTAGLLAAMDTIDTLTAGQAVLKTDGWKLVPVEPTVDMKQAALNVEVGSDLPDGDIVLTWEEVGRLYRALLDAAPTPQTLA